MVGRFGSWGGRAVLAVAVLVVGGGAGLGAAAALDRGPGPALSTVRAATLTVSPSASPSPSPSPSAALSPSASPSRSAPARDTGIRAVNWAEATLRLPALAGCPARRVPLHRGAFTTGPTDQPWQWRVSGLGTAEKPAYGDVDGDGVLDALVVVGCSHGWPLNADVVAFRMSAAGPAVIGTVTSTSPADLQRVDSALVQDGITFVVVTTVDPGNIHRVVSETRAMRWSGKGFVRADASVAILEAGLKPVIYRVPRLGACPAHTGTLPATIGAAGTLRQFSWETWWIGAAQAQPAVGDLTGDGRAERLIGVVCEHLSHDRTTDGGLTVAALTLDESGKPVVLGYLHTGVWDSIEQMTIHNGVATVTTTSYRDNRDTTASYRWDGSRFVPVTGGG